MTALGWCCMLGKARVGRVLISNLKLHGLSHGLEQGYKVSPCCLLHRLMR
jgi:hypothetical protein